MSGGGKLWGIYHFRLQRFLKGHVYGTKARAQMAITEITKRKRDPITNDFRNQTVAREIIRKTPEKK